MDEALGTFTKYIDFFILGAVAFLAISAPFKPFQPLLKGWRFLLYQCLPEVVFREQRARSQSDRRTDAQDKPSDKSIHFVQVGLAAAFLFALFYFAGIAVNAFGHSRLDAAHMLVIAKSHELIRNGTGSITAPLELYKRPLWALNDVKAEEKKAYVMDTKLQLRWSICDPTSYDSMNGGATIKHLRLIRGAIGTAFLVFIASCIALILALARKPGEGESRLVQAKWPFWSLVGSVFAYAWMLVPMYWNIELNTHTTIAAALPALADSDYALPCERKTFEYAIRDKGKFPFVREQPPEKSEDKKAANAY